MPAKVLSIPPKRLHGTEASESRWPRPATWGCIGLGSVTAFSYMLGYLDGTAPHLTLQFSDSLVVFMRAILRAISEAPTPASLGLLSAYFISLFFIRKADWTPEFRESARTIADFALYAGFVLMFFFPYPQWAGYACLTLMPVPVFHWYLRTRPTTNRVRWGTIALLFWVGAYAIGRYAAMSPRSEFHNLFPSVPVREIGGRSDK